MGKSSKSPPIPSDTFQPDPEDYVLLLLDTAQRMSSNPEFRGITRLEKLLFLLASEQGAKDAETLFKFEPYKFGPFSKDVYSATEFLRGLNLLEIRDNSAVSYYAATEETALNSEISDDEEDVPVPEVREKTFVLTPAGMTAAGNLRRIWQDQRPEDLEKILTVVRRYSRLPLNQLIRYVYRQFPHTTENSIHPEASRI
jgi:hypothetical protein